MVNKNLFVSAKTSLDESIEQAEIILEALQKMVVENDIAEVLQHINRSYSSVEQMKKDESLIEGQLLTVTGYYEGDTLSTHQRVVSKTDNGFGELLDNGLYANLLYQDNEINITHIGARNSYNAEKKIYDILPYVKKISDKGLTVFLPNGWWGISYYNFSKSSFKMRGCCIQPYFEGIAHYDDVITTVLFPIEDGQECTLHVGVASRESRAVEISGIQFVQNRMIYNDQGKFVMSWSGSKISLFLETLSFSYIHDLIITGTNIEAEYGIRFIGCETPFYKIMFRAWGAIGSNAKCAFYNYCRGASSTSMAMTPSGMTYDKIDYEGVGVTHFLCDGTDVHFTNSCNELGAIRAVPGHTYTVTSYDAIPDGATVINKGVICIGPYVFGAIFDSISMQKLGTTYKHVYTNSNGDEITEYEVWDRIFIPHNDYLTNVRFNYSNILLQENHKEIDIVAFYDNVGFSNPQHKGVIGAGLVTADTHSTKIKVRDNMGVQLSSHKNTIPGTTKQISMGNFKSVFQNSTLYPNDSVLQHSVYWDNRRQLEYMSLCMTTLENGDYSNHHAIFLVDEMLTAGEHTVYFKYENVTAVRYTKMKLTFSDSSTSLIEDIKFPIVYSKALGVTKCTFNQASAKRLIKIEIGYDVAAGVKLFSITHKSY